MNHPRSFFIAAPLQAILLTILLTACAAGRADADLPIGASMSGINDSAWRQDIPKQIAVLHSLGIGYARIGMIYGENPADLAPLVDQCVASRIRPVVLVEYYPFMGDIRHGAPTIFAFWRTLGRDLATACGRKVVLYTAFNEPDIDLYVDHDQKAHFDDPRGAIPVADYVQAIRGFAEGVHSVDKSLKVAPGGFGNPNYHQDDTLAGYGLALAPLLNDGTLDGIDLHTYGSDTDHWSVTQQGAFDKVKKACGVTRDIRSYCTEFNSGTKPGDDARFLTALWNNLGVVGNGGDDTVPVTGFSMPYTLFALQSEQSYGLATSLNPFAPSQRASTLELVSQVAANASFRLLEPHTSGIYVLDAPTKKIWVWQNYIAYSQYSGTAFPLTGIPAGTTSIRIYRYDSALNAPYRTVDIHGQSNLQIFDLPQNETLMFVADAPDRGKFNGISLDLSPSSTAPDPAVVHAPPDWQYCKALGFGYAPVDSKQSFLIDVPNGRYRVTISLNPGDSEKAMDISVNGYSAAAPGPDANAVSAKSFVVKVTHGQLAISAGVNGDVGALHSMVGIAVRSDP